MIKYNIEIQGESTTDLLFALEEVKAKIKEGYCSGLDSNDTGSYHFDKTADGETDDGA